MACLLDGWHLRPFIKGLEVVFQYENIQLSLSLHTSMNIRAAGPLLCTRLLQLLCFCVDKNPHNYVLEAFRETSMGHKMVLLKMKTRLKIEVQSSKCFIKIPE